MTTDERSPEQIEADLARTRERLSASVSQLQAATTPQALTARGVSKARALFFDEFGGIRPERVAMAVGGVVAYFLLRRPRK